MFWRVSGLNTASPVDSILDKESYTLEELLDEDELIQECKSLNARLTAYLKQKETVERLVRYLVEPPPEGADPRRSFKYPFTACEVFCCEVEGIFNTLLESEELLALLFSLLDAPRPLNCMLAGYFSRVMGSLLLRRTQDIMQYLQKHQGLLQQLVDHVDTTSIAEVLVRLVGADEQRAFLSTNHLQWLSETDLLYRLLDKLQPGAPVEAQSNAAEILAALAQSQVSPLTRNLAEPQFLELLVERALRRPEALPAPDSDAAADAPAADAPAADAEPAAEPAAAEGVAVEAEAATEAAPAAAGGADGAAAGEGEQATSEGGSSSEAAPAASPAAAARGDGPAREDTAAEAPAEAPSISAAEQDESLTKASVDAVGRQNTCLAALNVCIALVEPLPPSPADQQAAAQGLGIGGMPSPAIDAAAAEVHAAMRVQATQCIARSIDRLVALLDAADEGRCLPTSYGLLQPPVGLARLKAVELLAALLHSGDEAAESAVMGTAGVQRSLQLFLQFPFNNVLHRHVATLVTAVDRASPRLAEFLVGECGLLGWIVDAPIQVTPRARPGDPHAEQRRPLRAGYAGHLTQIANRLAQVASEGHEQLRAAMEGDARWQAYVRDVLEPRNSEESVFAWKCGRPTVHEQVVDAEADMFQTELDFGSIDSEAFTRDVYQRYGVFSTHEDEEVEAEQPQWAMEVAAAASAAGSVPTAPGKLPMPTPGGPQPFPVYDSSSSSSDDSDDERGADLSTSEDAEASVAPTPDGDVPLASGGEGAAAAVARAPLGSDDADMADDAVMLEYDAAEQLVSLSQLSLEDKPADAAPDSSSAAAAAPQESEQAAAAGGKEQQPAAAAEAEAEAVDAAAAAAAQPEEAAAGGKAERGDALPVNAAAATVGST